MITAKGASPAPTLIRAFRPLQDAFGPPAGARRYMTSKRLIWLILWRMITGKSQGRIDDSPCYPAFTGVGGALLPIQVSLEQDHAVYVEPDLWVHYRLG